MKQYEEGDDCPHWFCNGTLEIYSERGCTCFIAAPCGACTDAILICNHCQWETDKYGYGSDVDAADNIKHKSQVMDFI